MEARDQWKMITGGGPSGDNNLSAVLQRIVGKRDSKGEAIQSDRQKFQDILQRSDSFHKEPRVEVFENLRIFFE